MCCLATFEEAFLTSFTRIHLFSLACSCNQGCQRYHCRVRSFHSKEFRVPVHSRSLSLPLSHIRTSSHPAVVISGIPLPFLPVPCHNQFIPAISKIHDERAYNDFGVCNENLMPRRTKLSSLFLNLVWVVDAPARACELPEHGSELTDAAHLE